MWLENFALTPLWKPNQYKEEIDTQLMVKSRVETNDKYHVSHQYNAQGTDICDFGEMGRMKLKIALYRV